MASLAFDIDTKKGDKKFPANGNNTATTKKMVIADPGLGLQIKFSSDSTVTKILVEYAVRFVEVEGETGVIPFNPYQKLFDWTINGHTNFLNLSQDYFLVAPILNPGEMMTGHTQKIGYHIEVTYYNNDNEIANFSTEDELVYNSLYDISPNHIFAKDPGTAETPGTSTPANSFKETIFQVKEYGASCTKMFNVPETGQEILLLNQQNSNECTSLKVYHTGTQSSLDRLIYLPYPQIEGINLANYQIKIGAESFTPQSNFTPYDGDVTLKLTPHAFGPGKQ
ncbi:MAG: hypothetical protein KDD63_19845 [Bacteroidetes bacterium]|nr:hypothetical protein [Bacteroidota bacterium]MCB0842499.1 hypothetical protein [Bacteroidota bacterium]MCB0854490.1 hypothetical protein [Bacteroidota bacterium]